MLSTSDQTGDTQSDYAKPQPLTLRLASLCPYLATCSGQSTELKRNQPWTNPHLNLTLTNQRQEAGQKAERADRLTVAVSKCVGHSIQFNSIAIQCLNLYTKHEKKNIIYIQVFAVHCILYSKISSCFALLFFCDESFFSHTFSRHCP